MRVSFIIPTRNQAEFIRRCIDSCLSQRVPDSEIIVIDGNSDDGTQQILSEYGSRISWSSAPDTGQADAVNKGVERASGEIIAWINSDDYYEDSSSVASALAVFAEDPSCDLVYGEGIAVDVSGRRLRPYWTIPHASVRDVLLHPIGASPQPATFFRRVLFLGVGGLRVDLHYALDYELWLRMFSSARHVRYIPRVLARAVYHPRSKSIRGMLAQIREVSAIKREYARRLGVSLADRARMEAGIGRLYAYWTMARLGLKRVS